MSSTIITFAWFFTLMIAAGVAVASSSLPTLPWFDIVGAGYDITTRQVRQPVFANDYTHNNTTVYNGETYRVPNYAQLTLPPRTTTFTQKSLLFSNFEELQQRWVEITHWSSGLFGMDSHTREAVEIVDHLYQKQRGLAVNRVHREVVHLVRPISDYPRLHDAFVETIKALPNSYIEEEDPNHVLLDLFASALFAPYGVGVLWSAKLGGSYELKQWFNLCFISSKEQQWVTEQSSWSFLWVFHGGSGHSSYFLKINEDFRKFTKREAVYEGGNTTANFNATQFAEWEKTVDALPERMVPLTRDMQVASLADVLEEYPSLYNRAAGIRNATKAYLRRAQKAVDGFVAKAKAQHAHVPKPAYCKKPV